MWRKVLSIKDDVGALFAQKGFPLGEYAERIAAGWALERRRYVLPPPAGCSSGGGNAAHVVERYSSAGTWRSDAPAELGRMGLVEWEIPPSPEMAEQIMHEQWAEPPGEPAHHWWWTGGEWVLAADIGGGWYIVTSFSGDAYIVRQTPDGNIQRSWLPGCKGAAKVILQISQ